MKKLIVLIAIIAVMVGVSHGIAAPKPVGTNPVLVYCVDGTTGEWYQPTNVKGVTFRGSGVPDTNTSMLVYAPSGEQSFRVMLDGYVSQVATTTVGLTTVTKLYVLMYPR